MEQDQQTPSELSVEDALRIAIHLHRTGEFDDAEVLYKRILDAVPDHPDALQFLGVLSHQRGYSDAAIGLIEKSIALDSGQPDRYNNLGNVLLELERFAEATDAYQQAIALQPEHADAYNNLGAVLRAQGRLDEAGAAYLRAIELDSEHVDAHNNFGNLLSNRGRVKEAVAYYCTAITLMPNHPQSRKLLGIAYYTIGQIDAAAEVFHQWLQEEPDNPVAHHMYAACSGDDVPARASDAYVESTFDGFAASFDAKLGRLAYRAPELVTQALANACSAPQNRFIGLDAGCGTGLCGPLIAPYVCRLTGVDLSSGMLAKARTRGVYDELVKAELTAYLNDHPQAFDLVVSADTLVYFGALEAVLEAAWRALRPDGLFIFTVEEAADAAGAYCLNPHGRYSHQRAYVRQALVDAGFCVAAIVPEVLRMESGNPVNGLVVTATRLAAMLTM